MTAMNNSLTAAPAPTANAHTWRPLRVLCIYRMAVAVILLAGFGFGDQTGLLSTTRPTLFLEATLGYLFLSALALALALRRWPAFPLQVLTQTLADVIAITLLVHASGSLDAGLGVLMVVAVAGGSLLLGIRLGTFLAATATLALLTQQVIAQLGGTADSSGYTQVGALGIAIFATALAGALLARRARESDALATRRGVDVANLEALNAHIVQRLDTGVVALDSEARIRLLNRTARELLGEIDTADHPPLAEMAPALGQTYEAWRRDTGEAAELLPAPETGEQFLPRFHPLGSGGTLIFLENLTAMRSQVQQAKLASLGRLTASIAHEIRNPLSAMMHAAQLLGEADYLQGGEQRLARIIRRQGHRLNTTVENVLQLSRRAPANRELLCLGDWLPQFVADWREQQGPTLKGEVALRVSAAPVTAPFDPDHLRQILDNLIRNAVEHAGADGTPPQVELWAEALASEHAALGIRDNGPGIDPAVQARLFEPFTTTSSKGTGLGLYLVRELCEANQARVELVPDTQGTQFRILFGRPAS